MKKSYDFQRAKRGAVVQPPAGKTRITIRIDDDVLEWFRKQVHEHMERQDEPLEETLRRVLREVLPASPVKPRRAKAAKKPPKKSSRR
jgi:uncharacterized protein (DUF4415 family)